LIISRPQLGHLCSDDLADRRLALLIDGLRMAALAIGAGEEEAVLADAIEHRPAALFAL
jgi:hypothetical protein